MGAGGGDLEDLGPIPAALECDSVMVSSLNSLENCSAASPVEEAGLGAIKGSLDKVEVATSCLAAIRLALALSNAQWIITIPRNTATRQHANTIALLFPAWFHSLSSALAVLVAVDVDVVVELVVVVELLEEVELALVVDSVDADEVDEVSDDAVLESLVEVADSELVLSEADVVVSEASVVSRARRSAGSKLSRSSIKLPLSLECGKAVALGDCVFSGTKHDVDEGR